MLHFAARYGNGSSATHRCRRRGRAPRAKNQCGTGTLRRMKALVLGAAAGGGFPQWNSNAAACNRARRGDPKAPARTQASLAVSADDAHWFLFNASPDLRQQIEATPELHPHQGLRSSPIAGVVLTCSMRPYLRKTSWPIWISAPVNTTVPVTSTACSGIGGAFV